MPPPVPVPQFDPVWPGGVLRQRARGALRRVRRAAGVALALTALALGALGWVGPPGPSVAAVEPRGGTGPGEARDTGPPARGDTPRAAGAERVRAPVRLADRAVAALLRPGDRVDVVAAAPHDGLAAEPGPARVLARRATVAQIPGRRAAEGEDAPPPGAEQGALVVLSVPPGTAARLAGAAAHAPLAVTLW
ncbi:MULTISPECIES: RcpC/CpaB family pilus assembly protein [Streptomyces]|uniref:RcpC/CpaB family pilus assembly protein n=1 Tax=Streptomyces TaxID=1883 RepID=UPI0022497DCC|nr:RcpC/CpaB family pilus assembly protein [Streptomyces sp. JHD 1]MCX2968173.1 RcpC/CpaB family pilus assembly protein [Streptomyces sp. JHD 1]